MKLIPLIFVFILGLQSSMEDCMLEDEENECGAYCYKVARPILGYLTQLLKELHECKNRNRENLILKGKEFVKLHLEGLRLENLQNLMAEQEFVKLDKWMTACTRPPRTTKFCKILNGKHYFVDYIKSVTWEKAYNICRQMDGHLVSLKSEEEWNALRGHLDRTRRYWTDLMISNNDRNNIISNTTGTKPEYTNFAKFEPNNWYGHENCVELWNRARPTTFEMNDESCSTEIFFICERN
nr:hepatic lectin-like [Drosophila bipectinata]